MEQLIFAILALAITITIHEFAHAWIADHLGDPTARLLGRLTLNPIKHYDPVGSSLLLILIITGFPYPFGWAKPVPIEASNLRNPRKDMALIALAGPLANILFATIIALFARFSIEWLTIAVLLIKLNVGLAIFNLIPIYPLDGSKVLPALLPHQEVHKYEMFMRQYGTYLLFLIILPIFGGRSIISIVISPLMNLLMRLLLPNLPLF
jgi:Zn-dependent protease